MTNAGFQNKPFANLHWCVATQKSERVTSRGRNRPSILAGISGIGLAVARKRDHGGSMIKVNVGGIKVGMEVDFYALRRNGNGTHQFGRTGP